MDIIRIKKGASLGTYSGDLGAAGADSSSRTIENEASGLREAERGMPPYPGPGVLKKAFAIACCLDMRLASPIPER